MPFLGISVNTTVAPAQRSELAKAAAAAISEILAKDSDKFMVKVQDEVTICFGGSDEPCSFIALNSIGAIDPENNALVASALSALLSKHLAIDPSRVFINFHDIEGSNWGWNGKTLSKY